MEADDSILMGLGDFGKFDSLYDDDLVQSPQTKRARERASSASFMTQPKRGRDERVPSFDSSWDMFGGPPQFPESELTEFRPTTTWNFSSSDAGLRGTESLFPDPSDFDTILNFEQFLQPTKEPVLQAVPVSQSPRQQQIFPKQISSTTIASTTPMIRQQGKLEPKPSFSKVQSAAVPVTRAKKNVRERRRRAGLAQRFEQLEGLVVLSEKKHEIKISHDEQSSTKNKGKLSKATVLGATIDVVKALTRKVEYLTERNEMLMARIDALSDDGDSTGQRIPDT